jgi:hypothetical protein
VSDRYSDDSIANWVSDFCQDDAIRLFPVTVQEIAHPVLETLLTTACALRGVQAGQLEQDDLKHALLNGVARFDLPAYSRAFVPSLCRAFLENLQQRGRIGNGLTLGRYIGALKQPYLDASTSGAKKSPTRSGKPGRNDPCPCGSGKKYKKCCLPKEALG